MPPQSDHTQTPESPPPATAARPAAWHPTQNTQKSELVTINPDLDSMPKGEFYLCVLDDHRLVLHKPDDGKVSHTLDRRKVKHLYFLFRPEQTDKRFASEVYALMGRVGTHTSADD